MATTSGRRAADVMIGFGSFGAVVAGVSVLSVDVRVYLANLLAGDPAGELPARVLWLQDHVHTLIRAAVEYRAANGPMVGFGVVAVVLALLMFRW
jgi:hypothetical protein